MESKYVPSKVCARIWIYPTAPEEVLKIAAELERRHCLRPELEEKDGDFNIKQIDGIKRFVAPARAELLQKYAKKQRRFHVEGVAAVDFHSEPFEGSFWSKRAQHNIQFEGSEEDKVAVQELLLRLVEMMEKPETIAQASFYANVDQNAATVAEPSACPSDWMEFSQDSTHIAFIESYNAASKIQGVGNLATAARRKAFATNGIPTYLNVVRKKETGAIHTQPKTDASGHWIEATANVEQIDKECRENSLCSGYSVPPKPLGLCVLDIDVKNNEKALEQLEDEIDKRVGEEGAFAAFKHAVQWDKTKSNGFHIWLAAPQGRIFKKDSQIVGGVELKASGAIPMAGTSYKERMLYAVGNQGGVLSGGKIYDAILSIFEEVKEPIFEEKKYATASPVSPLNLTDGSWNNRVRGTLNTILRNIRNDLGNLTSGQYHNGTRDILLNLAQFKELMPTYASCPITLGEVLEANADHENPSHEGGGDGFEAGRKDIERLWHDIYEGYKGTPYTLERFIREKVLTLPERPNPNAKPVAAPAKMEGKKAEAQEPTAKAVAMNSGGRIVSLSGAFQCSSASSLSIQSVQKSLNATSEEESMFGNCEYVDQYEDFEGYEEYETPMPQAQPSMGAFPLDAFASKASASFYLNSTPKPYEYLLEGSLPKHGLGVLTSPPGAGKGFFSLQLAAHLACGKDFLEWKISKPYKVIYISAEDDETVIHNRIHAMAGMFEDEEAKLIESNMLAATSIFEYGGFEHRLMPLYKYSTPNGLSDSEGMDNFRALVDGLKPDLVIFDTLQHICPSVDENSTQGSGEIAARLSDFARRKKIAILLTHHFKKAEESEFVSNDKELNRSISQNASRGSSAIIADCRWALNIVPLETKYAKKTIGNIVNDNALAGTYLAVKVSKKNNGPREDVLFVRRGFNGFFEVAPTQLNKTASKLEQDTGIQSQAPACDSTEARAHRLVELVGEAEEPIQVNREAVAALLGCSIGKAKLVIDFVAEHKLLTKDKPRTGKRGNASEFYVLPPQKSR